MSLQDRVLAELPLEMTKFLGSLSESELNQLSRIDARLIAKVYQAGAVFSIEVFSKIAKEDKNAES